MKVRAVTRGINWLKANWPKPKLNREERQRCLTQALATAVYQGPMVYLLGCMWEHSIWPGWITTIFAIGLFIVAGLAAGISTRRGIIDSKKISPGERIRQIHSVQDVSG